MKSSRHFQLVGQMFRLMFCRFPWRSRTKLPHPIRVNLHLFLALSLCLASSGGDAAPKYMLYNPCATNLDPTYCQSQFNNQVVFFLHALSVAKTLGRTLVQGVGPAIQVGVTFSWIGATHVVNCGTP